MTRAFNNSGTGKPLSRLRRYLRAGDHWVWFSGAGTAAVLLVFAILIFVVAFHGLRAFWVPDVAKISFANDPAVFAAILDELPNGKRRLYLANRDVNDLDFRQVEQGAIAATAYPQDLAVFERIRNGPAFGIPLRLQGVDQSGSVDPNQLWRDIHLAVSEVRDQTKALIKEQRAHTEMGVQLKALQDRIANSSDVEPAGLSRLKEQERNLLDEYNAAGTRLASQQLILGAQQLVLQDATGGERAIPLAEIVRMYRPNRMSVAGKSGLYLAKLWELLTAYPRESNMEGGLFPAIFGTVLMVFLMSLFGVPLGVLTAVYMREYAKDGIMVRLVRIAVNNLAGVPSIVYGIFGLGFFVYGLGGQIDAIFFSDRLPMPTYGTGGLLWASLTMALLTVPVVIISTEEGLNAVPQVVREGSYALGATKLQTLWRVVLPMATPGMLTGLILAIARAAGEVAPLMLVGVVKSVPSLAIDGQAPFLHVERKFMHLGFHIYDVGFQSPNVEAAKPMVYVTTLLLLGIVLGLSYLATVLRNAMKKRYSLEAF